MSHCFGVGGFIVILEVLLVSRQRTVETIERSTYVTIGELVRLTGVRYSTLKFYTEEGMLPFEQAEENLTRRYNRLETIERISLIRRLRAEGKTVPQIKRDIGAQMKT
jgi:hypothetical protein